MSIILETNQLCKFYGTNENQVKAVNNVNIQIKRGNLLRLSGSLALVKVHCCICWGDLIHQPRGMWFYPERIYTK